MNFRACTHRGNCDADVCIPKSAKEARIKVNRVAEPDSLGTRKAENETDVWQSNADNFDFELDGDDMAKLDGLDEHLGAIYALSHP